jgi:hypothetical protein
VLVPDELQAELYADHLAPNLREGAAMAFAHGFNIHFRLIEPRPDLDVFMIAPKGPGHLVRAEYERGAGVPCLVAIHQDPSGGTLDLALSYGAAIGGGRDRGDLRAALVGSVPAQLLRVAGCPIVVLPEHAKLALGSGHYEAAAREMRRPVTVAGGPRRTGHRRM